MKIHEVTSGHLAGTFEVIHDGLVFSNEHLTATEAQASIGATIEKAREDALEAKDALHECEEWLHSVAFE